MVDRASKCSCCGAKSDWGQCFKVINIWTYWGQKSSVQCLLYNTHRCWKNVLCDWSVPQHCLPYIAFLLLLANRSHSPTKWSAAGGLNFHLIPLWIRCSLILTLYHAAMYSANSLSAPAKFVPLSLKSVIGLPLRALNLRIALRQLSVSKFGTNSICTALIVRPVKRQQHRMSFRWPIFTMNGPKKSTPTPVKAVEASNRS